MKTEQQKTFQVLMQRISSDHGLMPWEQVAEAFNKISGFPPITRTRVWQIGRRAEEKLRRGLADLRDFSACE